ECAGQRWRHSDSGSLTRDRFLRSAQLHQPRRAWPSSISSLIRVWCHELLSVPVASVELDKVGKLRLREVSKVPVPSAVAGAVHRPAPAGDRLREALLVRVQPATAAVWVAQDAELAAEMAALDAVDPMVPAE